MKGYQVHQRDYGAQRTNLLTNYILAGFNVPWDGRSPGAIGIVHHPHSTPHAILVDGVLSELEKLKLIDVHVGNIALVRGHPRGDGAFVAIQPPRPVERHLAAGPDLGDGARRWVVSNVTRDIRTVGVQDGTNVTTAEGDAGWGWVESAIDLYVPTWIARPRDK